MKLFQLERSQKLPLSIQEAWDFFSSPTNLSKITPEDMGFNVTSKLPEQMHAGLIITYKVKPLLGIPVTWVTEITHLREPYYFVDEQRFGPYKLWHHSHFFNEINGGVEMQDLVWYAMPFGFIGRMLEPVMVRGRLEKIFNYRHKILEKHFGKYEQ